MPAVTIGVPVYNGEAFLDEALSNLAAQSFGDFRVLIFDNASTDGTAAIARAWIERDSRFRYERHPRNIGGLANFLAALLAADAPWFLWRAYDDLSAPNYIEALHRTATASPGCQLAVSTIVAQDLDGGRRKETRPPVLGPPRGAADVVRNLLFCHPSWFYGLWDREALLKIFPAICERFPYAAGSDHITLYGPIIDGAVRATAETAFIQRYRRTATTPRRQGKRTPYAEMAALRRAFKGELRRIRSERSLKPSVAAALIASEPAYLHRTLPSIVKMARMRLRELAGRTERRPAGELNADV